MKHIIANRREDDPAETIEVAPMEFELDDPPLIETSIASDFADLIAEAAELVPIEDDGDKKKQAQAMLAEGIKELKDRVARETGHSVGVKDVWVYKPKPAVAYSAWKRIIPLFVQDGKTLDLGPTALVKWLNGTGASYTVTREMIYDPLNDFAVKDLKRVLRKLGVTLKLESPVTIRSVQKQLIERRDAKALPVDEFAGRFAIRGDKVFINGTPYKIQLGKSGLRRVQYGRRWLPIDVLKEICLATTG